MDDTELIRAFKEFNRKAILVYESICEQLVLDNFSDEEAMKIQTLVLDKAQAKWEEINKHDTD